MIDINNFLSFFIFVNFIILLMYLLNMNMITTLQKKIYQHDNLNIVLDQKKYLIKYINNI